MTDPALRAPALPARRWPRRLLRVAAGAALCAVLVLLWPSRLGGWSTLTVVQGHSMDPTLAPGDLVWSWRSGSYTRGDVIVYRVPRGEPGEGHLVIHRVVGSADGALRTRGDAKAAEDPWRPRSTDVLGRSVVVFPGAGRVVLALPLLAALLAGVFTTASLWPRVPSRPAAPEGPRRRRRVRPSAAAVALLLVVLSAQASSLGGLSAPAFGARSFVSAP